LADPLLIGVEADSTVDPQVAAGPVLRLAVYLTDGPPLELEVVLSEERPRALQVCRDSFRRVGFLDLRAVCVKQPLPNQVNRKIGNVDPNPASAELLSRRDRRSATAEGIEDDFTFVARCLNDAFQQRCGF